MKTLETEQAIRQLRIDAWEEFDNEHPGALGFRKAIDAGIAALNDDQVRRAFIDAFKAAATGALLPINA